MQDHSELNIHMNTSGVAKYRGLVGQHAIM